MTHRVYVVGTDTGVGKTQLCCALLRLARGAPVRVVPFKPAQSGDDDPGDAQRLLDAAGLDTDHVEAMCPLRYDAPVAPGVAEDPTPFRKSAAANAMPDPPVLETVQAALRAWERRTRADIVLLEGAGGFHVPMPGGTWQPQWITALATSVIVTGRAGLGTINHTLLTLDALASLGCKVLGFYLVQTVAQEDPSVQDNAAIIATARGHAYLGTLGFAQEGRAPLLAGLLDTLGTTTTTSS